MYVCIYIYIKTVFMHRLRCILILTIFKKQRTLKYQEMRFNPDVLVPNTIFKGLTTQFLINQIQITF